MNTYLDVLSDASKDWKPGEDHEIVIVFPPEAQERIIDILT
jgi:hypothetical protein